MRANVVVKAMLVLHVFTCRPISACLFVVSSDLMQRQTDVDKQKERHMTG